MVATQNKFVSSNINILSCFVCLISVDVITVITRNINGLEPYNFCQEVLFKHKSICSLHHDC